MALSNPLVRNVLGRFVYPAINTFRNLFSDTGRILTTLALFAKSVTLGCGSNFFPSILEEMTIKLNSDSETISKVFKIFAIMSMVGSILGIFIFKKVRRQLGTMYILVGISVSMIMIPNCPGVDSFFIAVGIFGALVGLIVPGQIVWTMEMWQKQSTPILQALMFFFSIGMTLPAYITAPFLTPISPLLSNATGIGDLDDLLMNGTSSVPSNGTAGHFLTTLRDKVVRMSGDGPPELSNIHIPFAIVGVMAFFNAWMERLLFKHYNYVPPAPQGPETKPEEEKKAEDKKLEGKNGENKKFEDEDGQDPSKMGMKQLKKNKNKFEEEEWGEEEQEEEEEVEEEEEDEEAEEHEEESEEEEKDEDDDDDDDEGGYLENEKTPMLKNQKSFLKEIPVEIVKMPMSKLSSATLPTPKQIVSEVQNAMSTLPATAKKTLDEISGQSPSTAPQGMQKKAPEQKSSSTLEGSTEKLLEDNSTSLLVEAAREGRRQSTLRREGKDANALRRQSSSKTRPKRRRSGSGKGKRKSQKKGRKEEESKKEDSKEDEVEEVDSFGDDEEEVDSDVCEPLLPSGGKGAEGQEGIDLFNINSDDDTEAGRDGETRASTASMLDDLDDDDDVSTEEVSEFSDDEGYVVTSIVPPPPATSSKEDLLSGGNIPSELTKIVQQAAGKDSSKVVESVLKSSKDKPTDKPTEEARVTETKEGTAKEDAVAPPKSTLSDKDKEKKKKEEEGAEKEKTTKDGAAPSPEEKKEKEGPGEGGPAGGGGGVPPTGKAGSKSKGEGEGAENEIKAVEKETVVEVKEVETEAAGGGDDAEGGNPVQKIINKIMGIKKIAVGVWNMLRDPVQRRGLIVIALSSVFFGAYAAIEKCSKDNIPGLGQEGNLKLDEEGGGLILKGFTMAFMVGRLAGMVVSLKVTPFLLLCSDLALVFLGNFILIFGASFSEHIMLVGSVLLGIGLSTIYAGLFTYLCGQIAFTDTVGSVLIVASTIATSVYADLIEGFISGNAQRLTSANYISGLTCTLAFKLIYSISKPKKPTPPPLEQVVAVR